MQEGQQQTSDYYFKIFGEFKSDSYFSKYGMDVLLSIFILFIILLLFMYMKTQANKNYYIYGKYTDENGEQQSIWNREKCKPHILPFSGNLHRPDPSKSAFETTMNNFEECIKSPFNASNLEMLNPFRLVANVMSVLLTTLTAIISGVKSYIQAILDLIFVRFKENKETLSNIQVDIMKRFISGVYGKLNSSFRSLRDTINTFTDEVYENYLAVTVSQINLTVKSYFRFWLETAILKNIGAALRSAAYMFYNTIIFAAFGVPFHIISAILLGISELIGAEMQPHYNLLSAARENVPAPIGGAADYATDKEYSLFYGEEYDTTTILDNNGEARTSVQQLNRESAGGNMSEIEDITKASVKDLTKMWKEYSKKNGVWINAIETNNKIIQEMYGLSDEEWNSIERENRYNNQLDWPGSPSDGAQIYKDKNIQLSRWLGKRDVPNGKAKANDTYKEKYGMDWPEMHLYGLQYFISDNINYTIRIKMKDSYWNTVEGKRRLAIDTDCPNLNLYVDSDEKALIMIQQKWSDGFMQYKPMMTGKWPIPQFDGITTYKGNAGVEWVAKAKQDDSHYEESKSKKDDDENPIDNVTDSQHRLYASRMWYWENEVHRYVPGSARIRQGRNGSYAEGDITFKLYAYKSSFDKNDVFATRGGRVGTWEEKASFKNSVMTDADCMSGCFGKNVQIKMNNGKMKAIYKIKPGDILENNNKVNGVMKCKLAGKSLYKLNETIVTSHHRILHDNKFIHAYMHPNAIKYNNTDYDDNFVYCLTTDSKTIKINEEIFTDWDELNEKDIINLKRKLENEFERETINTTGQTIHKYIDSGFHPYTSINMQKGKSKYIKNIKCGDMLENGSKVTAVIKIDAADIPIYKHSINDVSIFGTQNLVYNNDNNTKTTYYTEKERELYKPEKTESIKYLYHILTDKNEFNINKITFACYNKNLEIFL